MAIGEGKLPARGGIGNSLAKVVDTTLYSQTTFTQSDGSAGSDVHAVSTPGTRKVFNVPGSDL